MYAILPNNVSAKLSQDPCFGEEINSKRFGTFNKYALVKLFLLEFMRRLYITKRKHFDIISILNVSLEDKFLQVLQRIRFKTNSVTQIRERRAMCVWPLLVRPVKGNYAESDWYIEGLGIRRIENWKIKDICSDGW